MHERPTTRHLHVADDVELHVMSWEPTDSTGSPMLLVHGLASNAQMWAGCAAALAELGHPTAAVDLRGHGRSSKPDDGYDFGTIAADLVSVIEQLGFDRPVVAGQSWGGNVAVELAARAPGVLRGIALIDGGTIELQDRFETWDEVDSVLRPPNLIGTRSGRMLAMMRASHPDWPHSGIEGAMANFEELPDGTLRPWLTLERHLLILRELWEHRPSTRFGELDVPVLFVPADDGVAAWTHDKEGSIATAAAAVPAGRSRTVWFRPADHDLHAQFPDRLAAVLHGASTDGFFV